MNIVKVCCSEEKELLKQKLLIIPMVENLIIRSDSSDGFIAFLEFLRGDEISIQVHVMAKAYPK